MVKKNKFRRKVDFIINFFYFCINKVIDMELTDKIELNKKIRAYKGTNNFVLSLQKQLKTNKYLNKVEWKGKQVKILSDKQYEAALTSLD